MVFFPFFLFLPQIIPMSNGCNNHNNHINHIHPDMFNTSSSSDEFTPENSSPIQNYENNLNGSNNTSEEDEEDIKVDKSAKKGKRGRKPSLVSGTIKNIKVDPNFVELPLEALYKFDSEKMENYLKQLLLNRKLSSEEEGELKKIRRLIKNREYAQSSRNKKRKNFDQAQTQLTEVSKENDDLRKRNEELESKMMSIQKICEKDSSLFSKMEKSLAIFIKNFQYTPVGYRNDNDSPLSSSNEDNKPKVSKKRKAAYLIILFSFAFMFQIFQFQHNEDITTVESSKNSNTYNTGRTLLSLPFEQTSNFFFENIYFLVFATILGLIGWKL